MSVETVRLETLAAEGRYSLIGGPFGSKLTSKDYVAEGIPVIRGSNMNGGRYLDETDFVFVSEQKMREDLFGNLAYPGDVVFTQRGTLGQVALIPSEANTDTYVISQSQMKLTVDPEKADPRFIYYYFSSSEAQQRILNQNSSSGVPHINLTALRNFPVPKLQVSIQRAIADILSAYDDLIETNRRRIALLEEAARLLYREWFVHFRFPGHEHTEITNGLPKGWKARTLGRVVDVVKDTVKPADFSEDDIHIGLEHIPRRSFTLADWEPAADLASGKTRFAEGDILFCKIRPYFHKSGFSLRSGLASSDAIVWRVKESEDWPLVVCATSSDHFIAVASKTVREGSKMPRADEKVLNGYPIPKPPEGLLSVFNDTIRPITQQCKTLALQNRALAQARDILLPRLMNGEITV